MRRETTVMRLGRGGVCHYRSVRFRSGRHARRHWLQIGGRRNRSERPEFGQKADLMLCRNVARLAAR